MSNESGSSPLRKTNLHLVLFLLTSSLVFPVGTASSQGDGEHTPAPELIDNNSENQTVEEAGEQVPIIEAPEVLRDLSLLPFPTRRMRELILEATQSGDIEKLRALVGFGDNATQLSLGDQAEDPITFLKELSGDSEGHEILAILEEVLQTGFVHLDPGTEHELFVWPYFFSYPIDQLDDRQRVELFRIITFGDYLDMQDFGGYIFYRVGISPTGRWHFFVAGD